MLIGQFAAGPLSANCYVFAGPDHGGECIVVDPGQQAIAQLRDVVTALGLRPAAVLLTHGHFDHVADAAEVCSEFGADVYLGGGDVGMLDDQWTALSDDLRAGVRELLGPDVSFENLRPQRLTPLGGGEQILVAGEHVRVVAVPGHTPGSVSYRFAGPDGGPDLLCTGDTLFSGNIGRTDLPGGSSSRILDSIHRHLLSLPDDTVVLPGHGPATTIGAERSGNPFVGERARRPDDGRT